MLLASHQAAGQLKCQNCHLPLVINESLLNLSTAQQKLLISDKTFSTKQNRNSEDVAELPLLAIEKDTYQDERLQLFKEATRQSDGKVPTSIVLPRIKGMEKNQENADNEIRNDLEKLEDAVLDKLSNLELNIDEVDDEKLLELVDDIAKESAIYDIDIDGTNISHLTSNFNLVQDDSTEFEDHNNIISNRINHLTRIFNVLSFKYDIDYPICVECSETLLNELKRQYDESMTEKNSYLQFLNKLNKQSSPDLTKLDSSLAELSKLTEKYNESIEEIKGLEEEETQLEREIEQINEEISGVNRKEADLVTKKNLYELELTELNELNNQTVNNLKQKVEIYDKLKSSNVFNDVFNISYDGPFGTINELRLGNMKNCKVSWLEINSALGQIVLLLSIIIKKLSLKIDGYKLVPMGSYSKIEKYDLIDFAGTAGGEGTGNASGRYKKTVLECYSSGSSTFERLFTHTSLDQAMIALLNVIKQMEDQLKNKFDKGIELPYAINLNNNKIGGLNIKLNRKITDDEWTMACKFLITNVKYILAFASTKMNLIS